MIATRQLAAGTASATLPGTAAAGLLQRRPAASKRETGEDCPDCRKKRGLLQRKPADLGQPATAPSAVHDVLRSPGRPLDLATRAAMEPAFGHDFSRVQVHHATTVQLQRDAMDDPLFGNRSSEGLSMRRGSTLPYREATQLLDCIRIMGEENSDFCREQVLGEGVGISGPSGATPAAAQPAFVACNPNRPLTWADFTGTPSGSHSAFTAYDYPTAATPSGTRIQAVFAPSRSFVRPQFGNPTNSGLNGCDANVAQCQTFFPPGSTGGSFALNSTPSATCPAAVRANPAVVATTSADCTGIIATECARVAQAESDRLLRHEQLHFDIACVLAGKANAALAAGTALATVQTALTTKDTQTTQQYDTQTRHGCLAGPQSTWQTNVAAGLTAVTIP